MILIPAITNNGTYLTYKNSNWNLDGAFYYQMGKNKAAEKVSKSFDG